MYKNTGLCSKFLGSMSHRLAGLARFNISPAKIKLFRYQNTTPSLSDDILWNYSNLVKLGL